MATRRVMLTYPDALIREPIVSRMIKRFDVEANIRWAQVSETVGALRLELTGPESALNDAVAYLEAQGVEVEPLEGDVVSP